MKTEQIPAIFGGRKTAGKRYIWVLSLLDLRVYIREENTHMDTLTMEIDDFLGDLPDGFSWDYQMILGNKRIEQLMCRVKARSEKTTKEYEEDE